MPTNVYTSTNPDQTSFQHLSTSGDQQVLVKPLTAADLALASLSALFWVDRGTTTPVASQNGNIESPMATVQGGVNVSPSTGAALNIVGADYSAENVNVVGASKVMAFVGTDATGATVGSITAAATFRCERVGVTGNVSSADGLELRQCFVAGNISGADLSLSGDPAFGNDFGINLGTVTATSSVNANRWNFGAGVTAPSLDANDCVLQGAVVVSSGSALQGCSFSTTFNSAAPVATNCTFTGAVTATNASFTNCTFGAGVSVTGNATITQCSFGGNLTVTGTLTIDSQSFVAAQQQGHTITAGTLIVLGGLNAQATSIGNTLAAPLVLTLLPAGHPAGQYVVTIQTVVRTAATGGSYTPVLALSAPILGATSIAFGALTINTAGESLATVRSIVTSGATALVMTCTPVAITGSPVVDVYCSVQRIGF